MKELDKKHTYFITGGGTGGHIYPAVAVADKLSSMGHSVFYVGNPENLEYTIVNEKGYEFLPVNIHGMPRRFGIDFLKWAVQLTTAWLKSCYYIHKYKPDAVFGTGGYVSAPILLACRSFVRGKKHRIPYMLHDCDAKPGLVTRKLSGSASCVSLAFECAKDEINNKNCLICGNPIRETFKSVSKSQAREKLKLQDRTTLCIMGGSQGARSINDGAVEVLQKLSKYYNIQIIFQTGKKNFERVIEQLLRIYPEYAADKNLLIKPYFDDMVTVLKASDIAISRSGSLSLSELCASGIASILVPYPHAAADHQRKNARYMEAKGAALYLEDEDVSGKTLSEMILLLINNTDKLKELQSNALSLARLDGVDMIANKLQEIAE